MPLLPTAPAIVALVGIALAFAIAWIGLGQLRRASDSVAQERASALSATLALRLRYAPLEDRADLLGQAARRTGAELLLVEQSGAVVINETYGMPEGDRVLRWLVASTGETQTAIGRVKFSATPLTAPLEQLSVVSFVSAPSSPPSAIRLMNAVAGVTLLIVGLAAAVAFGFAKDARDDVDYVRERIAGMARADADPELYPIAVRSLDQAGVLTAAFNVLIARFLAAQRSYRADLERARALDQERSAFLAGLSHELRTPMNAILGFSHILDSEIDGPLTPDARESLAMIQSSGEHLRTLIDDILELSALETGQLKLTLFAVDVREVVEEVVREAQATVVERELALSVTTLGEGAAIAHADRRRVRQIVTNLVSNAVKFTHAGSISVLVESGPRYVTVTVSDTGPGIAAEDLQAIFREYRQAGDLRSRRAGTGLGLAIARRLVALHGGSIHARSHLGRGASFVFTLPIAPPGGAP